MNNFKNQGGIYRMDRNNQHWIRKETREIVSEKRKGKDIEGSDSVNPKHQHQLEQNYIMELR